VPAMAKSKAAKSRKKHMREGKMDPTKKRGTWGEISPLNLRTKTKHEAIKSMENKYKKNLSQTSNFEDGSFFYFIYDLSPCLQILRVNVTLPVLQFS
jgi:hypothetical protein